MSDELEATVSQVEVSVGRAQNVVGNDLFKFVIVYVGELDD